MLRIALCDDEKLILDYYRNYISRILLEQNQETEISTFSRPEALLAELQAGKRFEAYFLDIDMPGMNGLLLGKELHRLDPEGFLIYLSIRKDKVFDSFENRPFRFIPKDEFVSRIRQCLADICSEIYQDNEEYLVIEIPTIVYRYRISDIVFIQSIDKYVTLHLLNGTTTELIRYRLTDLEKELSEKGFLRIHRSYLVNYRCIQRIHPGEIWLDNGDKLPASRYRLEEVKQAYRRLSS